MDPVLADRVPGQVCDRCRRRKIRCHGDGTQCSPCAAAGVVCVTATKLKRNRKRKSFYESAESAQRRLDLTGQEDGQADSPMQSISSTSPHELGFANASSVAVPSNMGSEAFDPELKSSFMDMNRANDLGKPRKPLLPSSSASAGVVAPPKPGREPVIGHMGRLVSDGNQSVKFCGSSTGVHLVSQAEQQVQMQQMHTENFPSCAYSLHILDLWGTSSVLGDSELVHKIAARLPADAADILEAAVDRWVPIYPVVHKHTMIDNFQQILDGTVPYGRDAAILYQVLGLLALGTLGWAGNCARSHYHMLCVSETYYSLAATLLDKIMRQSNLETLQGLQIMQIYLQISSRHSEASHICGIATRMAQNLGLHRHSNRFKFDPLETELRRRAWWCQYTLDVYSSCYHGLPRLIRDQDVDTDPPTSVDHDLLTRSHVAFPLPGERSQVDTALALFKLARIHGDSLEKLYTTTQRRGGIRKILRLQAELDMWERLLPDEPGSLIDPEGDSVLDGTNEALSGGGSFETKFLRIAHCVATMNTHRPALAFTTPDPQFAASLRICVQVSAKLIRIVSSGLSLTGEPAPDSMSLSPNAPFVDAAIICLLYPNGIHMLWQAGLTILFAHWKGLYVDGNGDASGLEDAEHVRQCAEALRKMPAATDEARNSISQAADVLDTLRAKTFAEGQPLNTTTDQLQYNVWDWPMTSALELVNTLDAAPFDLYLDPDPWVS